MYSTNDESYGVYCDSYSLEECYGYKIEDDEITYYMTNMFHGIDDFDCYNNENNEVLKEYKITYKDGRLSNPKKVSSMTSKEYAQKHKINCQ